MTAGLYVHIPFCLTRCGYCDFNTYADRTHLGSGYLRALRREADLASREWSGKRIDTIFLGGGTPTILDAADLIALLGHLRSHFDVASDAEITTEANPDTVGPEKLAALRAGGFARISIGAQSFDQAVLGSLERLHSPDSARRAFLDARDAGFDNVNLDLIYGAEGESIESWGATLAEAIELAPEHVSAYALTVEPNTPLGRRVASGIRPAPDADLQADMFSLACEVLRDAGYGHYEVSNWSKRGRECRHNLGYWRRAPYLGLGAGAHSYRDGRRWWNTRSPESYMRAVDSGEVPIGGEEFLTPEEVRTEEFLLRLRTQQGVPAGEIDSSTAEPYLDEGLLVRRGDGYVLTEPGLFLANELVLALVSRGS